MSHFVLMLIKAPEFLKMRSDETHVSLDIDESTLDG